LYNVTSNSIPFIDFEKKGYWNLSSAAKTFIFGKCIIITTTSLKSVFNMVGEAIRKARMCEEGI